MRWFHALLKVGMGGWVLLSVDDGRGADSLAWHQEAGYRWRELEVPATGKIGFTRLTPERTGVVFTNLLTEWDGAQNRVLYNGAGLAVGDYNRDGLPDVYFCGLNTPNVLFQNLGQWKFKPVTREAGVACEGNFHRGATFADLDGDGWEDLLISTLARGVRCFMNLRDGRFIETTAQAGTASDSGSSTLALADVDGNGTLDLYISNYRPTDIRDEGEVKLQLVRGQIQVPVIYRDRLVVIGSILFEYGQPDQLLLNDGQGHFQPTSWTDGTFLDESGAPLTRPPLDWGLTATFRDLNDDRLPDLYLCNDYWTPDRIWINQGQGRFRALHKLALRNTSASSMGMDCADFDRDGDVDLFVLDMLSRDHKLRKRQKMAQNPALEAIGAIDNRLQNIQNTLQENRGDGTYREVSYQAGVSVSDWSWSVIFLDVDLDGFEDLLIPSGHFKDVQDMDANALIQARQRPRDRTLSPEARRRQFSQELLEHHRLYPRFDTPVVAFRNRGDGTFEEVTSRWGTDDPGVHHSIASADFDLDGDLDLMTNNLETQAGVYRNDTDAPRVAVRLQGLPPNTQGIGATIRLLGGAVSVQSQEITAGGHYLAGSEPVLSFATGPSPQGLVLEVLWRSGKRSRVANVMPNCMYVIEETGAHEYTPTPPKNTPPAFRDVSQLLAHQHQETLFDDFALQPLLPFKLSQAGPALCWFDLDANGHLDLVVGSGRDGALCAFLGDGEGSFRKVQSAPGWIAPDDITSCLGWHRSPREPALLLGVGGYEVPGGAAIVQVSLREDRLVAETLMDKLPGAVGPLALADMDADGDLDLFIGGRSPPARYPETSPSLVYGRRETQWVLDVENSKAVAGAGIVNGAVWSDLTGDGFPELVLACEWGPVRVFANETGRLKEITDELGLSPYIGWWRGVTTGDLNRDGQLDIVATNWGLNSPFEASFKRPLRLLYGDFMGAQRFDLIETEYDPATGALVPSRHFNALAPSLPFLYERFRSFRQFSESSIPLLLGEYLEHVRQTLATTLASTVFFNARPRFEAVPLPRAAQLAPAFSVSVADFDGDGHEDVFLSQNFFATRLELPRRDAGRGLWLKGDGQGGLAEVLGQVSGIQVYGEQRGAATGDFNGDGRVDLAVAQNGAETKLFENVTAKPGLRIRLEGPPHNPAAVGAVIRLRYADGHGPAREIHLGSGYWSQDSAVQVMHPSGKLTGIWVRWPGGAESTRDLDAPAQDVTLTQRR